MVAMIVTSPLSKAHWPWPKMDLEEVARRAMDWDLYMPNIGYITVDHEDAWRANFGDAANSKRLWINSLVSAHACLEVALKNNQFSYANQSGLILKSYLYNYGVCSGTFKEAWTDEHAVANRLFVLVAFLHALCDESKNVISESISRHVSIIELLSEAYKHAQWLYQDAYYVENNHGTMMDLSLAQFGAFLKVIDPITAAYYIDKALQRLNKMFESTFDKNGCCTENSPTYHFVNYALFAAIGKFIEDNQLGKMDGWALKLSKARRVGHLLLRADGTIPLVGDSEIRPGAFFPRAGDEYAERGVGYYPDAGLFIASMSDLHLSFRAGGAKFTHRHVDDLSFTLQYKGRDFFVDCGMYNYDISDKLRRWFISSRAHSGVYLQSMGDIRFAEFKSPAEMSKFISAEYQGSDFTVRAVHNLTKGVEVFRSITKNMSTITIKDSFDCELEQSWRMQFNLHPDVEIHPLHGENAYVLHHGEVSMVIAFNSNAQSAIEDINYSPVFMKCQQSQSIVVSGVGMSLNNTTSIELVT